MHPVFRTLAQLEAVDVTKGDVNEKLAERGAALAALADADLTHLEDDERRELRNRIRRLVQSDANVILEARAAMRDIDQGRRNVQRGRKAVAGYRAANGRIASDFEKNA